MRATRSFLQRMPVTIHARGHAVTFDGLPATAAVETYARDGIERGEIVGYTLPIDEVLHPNDPVTAVLFVPQGARSSDYPRAINAVPVQLVRTAALSPVGRGRVLN